MRGQIGNSDNASSLYGGIDVSKYVENRGDSPPVTCRAKVLQHLQRIHDSSAVIFMGYLRTCSPSGGPCREQGISQAPNKFINVAIITHR
jgi:hypothetical protein